jgi:AraC-like DNA-binding protein
MGHPLAFAAYLQAAGAPVDRLLRRHSLPTLCNDPNAFVPLRQTWSFFDTAARHAGPALDWPVGGYAGDRGLNLALLHRLESAPTLLEALRELQRLAHAEASHIQMDIRERGHDVLVCTRYAVLTDHPGYHVSHAYQLGVIVDVVRHFLGRCWVPEELGVRCESIPVEVRHLYPGARIRACRPAAYVAVPRRSLHRAVSRPLSGSASAAEPALADTFDFLGTLRSVLPAYVADGYPRARFLAELMGVSERTLMRKLASRGVSYAALVDGVRFRIATRLLVEEDLRIGDVAREIGFTDQSHFTRMFRRVGGVSPREFRKAALRAPCPSASGNSPVPRSPSANDRGH